MKKIINNPVIGISVLFGLFGIALIDAIFLGANSLGEMRWWSLSAVIILLILFFILAVKYMFLPFFRGIINKKK